MSDASPLDQGFCVSELCSVRHDFHGLQAVGHLIGPLPRTSLASSTWHSPLSMIRLRTLRWTQREHYRNSPPVAHMAAAHLQIRTRGPDNPPVARQVEQSGSVTELRRRPRPNTWLARPARDHRGHRHKSAPARLIAPRAGPSSASERTNFCGGRRNGSPVHCGRITRTGGFSPWCWSVEP